MNIETNRKKHEHLFLSNKKQSSCTAGAVTRFLLQKRFAREQANLLMPF